MLYQKFFVFYAQSTMLKIYLEFANSISNVGVFHNKSAMLITVKLLYRQRGKSEINRLHCYYFTGNRIYKLCKVADKKVS